MLAGRVILAALAVGLIYWQWGNLVAWANGVTNETLNMFGWGLIMVIITVLILSGITLRYKQRSALFYFRTWVAGITLMIAIWGIFSLQEQGGTIGLAITGQNASGYPITLSILRLAGFFFLAVIAMAPIQCLKAAKSAVAWAQEKLKARPAPPPPAAYPTPPQHTPPQTTMEPPEPAPPPMQLTLPTTPTPTPVTPTPTAAAKPDLKQVTEDVWKKYGESSNLETIDGWMLPPIDILDRTPEVEFSQADNMQRAKIIEDALGSYGVEAKVVQINTGPTVTQFGIEPGWDRKVKDIKEKDKNGNISIRQEEISRTRVKVDRITSLANDLALALAAPSIRIEAPVPGKSIVGVEVPNTNLSMVSLRGVIESTSFQKLKAKSNLALALGKGAGGEAVSGDLGKMPHLLIAGATGSGKTVCLNAVICCLMMYNPPTLAQFIMIDPKRVELTPYNSIPHLSTPVIVDTNKALATLRWLNQEMDGRYKQMAASGARNIEAYNKNKQGDDKLPYLVLVIDELADLMMTGSSDEVEHILCRLAQLARATGIHLVVATQRPSVDVVTGLIKANFPSRISFAVTSQVDSRTILDGAGAEKLLGRGDMLYMPTDAAKPKRLQGCYVSEIEMERLVSFWEKQRLQKSVPIKVEALAAPAAAGGASEDEYPRDPLLESAKELARAHKHISTSFLQRKLHIGYPRAARIMEQLEEEGFRRGEE